MLSTGLLHAGCVICPASLSDSQGRGCMSLGSQSRIDLSPAYRPVVNSSTAVTARWPFVWTAQESVNAGLIHQRSQMPEPEWTKLVKCGFGMYEKRSLLLCSSCSVNYYDYWELSASCDCCSQSAGNNQQWFINQLTTLNRLLPLRGVTDTIM